MSNDEESTSDSSENHQSTPRKKKKKEKEKCHVCGLMISQMRVHMRTHTGEKPFECNDCGKTFARKETMKNHIQAVHTDKEKEPVKKKKCSVCDKLVSTKSIYSHMKTHTKPFLCNDCGKNFSSKTDLAQHINHRHTAEELKVKPQCPVCSKMLSDKTALWQHLKTHTGERPYKCPHCDKTFSANGNLAGHIKSVHKTGEPLKCELCDKVLYEKYLLKRHMKTHTGEKSHQCTFCDKRFTNSRNCATHMRKHTGERPYFCEQCDNTFTSRLALTDHERTHSEEKTYKCGICSKAFLQYRYLWSHMKNHQEERPYKCNKCPKRFKHHSSLWNHALTCRAKKRKRSESGDEGVFRPVIEQIGPHQMKRCSVVIRRVCSIEDAIQGGCKSIVLANRSNSYHHKLIR